MSILEQKSKKFIWLFISALWCFSLVFMIFYSGKFNFHKIAIVIHMGLVTASYGIFLLLATLWVQLTKNKKSFIFRILPALGLGIVFFSLLQLYLLNLISLYNWGENISYKIVFASLADLPGLVNALPYTASSIYLLLLGIPIIVFSIFLLLSNKIYTSLQANYSAWRQFRFWKSSSFTFAVCALLGFLLITYHNYWLRREMRNNGEPIYNFIHPFGPSSDGYTIDLKEVEQIRVAKDFYKNLSKDQYQNQKNVVLIIVDAMRADHMSLYGYERKTTPFLDSLYAAQKLDKIDWAVSTCATSFCGILSILSSQIISELSCGNYKLSDVFADLGYQTNFILSGMHNDWLQIDRFYNFHHKVDFLKDGPQAERYSAYDDHVIFDFLDELGPPTVNAPPAFFYFHLMSAHKAGNKYPQYAKFQPATKTSYLNPDSLHMVNSYNNGIVQADAIVQQIFEKLQAFSYLENALVIITADHGEAVGERGRFAHGGNIYNENTNIPILFHDTAGDKIKYKGLASQIDIAPIILNHLNIPIPDFWDGSATDTQTAIKFEYQQEGDYYAVISYTADQVMNYIVNDRTGKKELFDITFNPMELENVVSDHAHTEILKECQAKLKEIFKIEN